MEYGGEGKQGLVCLFALKSWSIVRNYLKNKSSEFLVWFIWGLYSSLFTNIQATTGYMKIVVTFKRHMNIYTNIYYSS